MENTFFQVARNVYYGHGVTDIDIDSDIAYVLATDKELAKMKKESAKRQKKAHKQYIRTGFYPL